MCGNRFEVIRLTDNPSKVNPRCPRKACKGKSKESHVADIGFDASEGKAPSVGGSIVVRSTDLAMEVGMANAGITNINDRARYGEISAPRLAPHLQAQADQFWGNGRKALAGQRRARANVAGLLNGSPPPSMAASPNFSFSSDAAMLPIHRAPESKPNVTIEATYPPRGN
jgi:hypothetical protein